MANRTIASRLAPVRDLDMPLIGPNHDPAPSLLFYAFESDVRDFVPAAPLLRRR